MAALNIDCLQGCISCGTCSYPELTDDHVLTSAYVKSFRIVTRNAVNKSFWRKKRLFLTSLKQICNEYLIKFSENQSAPKLENRKTSPCSPCAPNLLHVLVSRILGYHNLCSPAPSLFMESAWFNFLESPIDNFWLIRQDLSLPANNLLSSAAM